MIGLGCSKCRSQVGNSWWELVCNVASTYSMLLVEVESRSWVVCQLLYPLHNLFKKVAQRRLNAEFLNKYDVLDSKTLDNDRLLISYIDKNFKDESNFNTSKSVNVSLPLASAITAYARVFMSQFKNDPNIKIFYTDTDSLFTDKELDPKLIGNELGQFKLEYVFKDAVFLAPKVYGGITVHNQEIVKVKGYKNHISFTELKSLLNKNSNISLIQNKWFKDLGNSSILIKDQIYTLTATDNKRELVYKNGVLIDTKNIIIKR